MKGFPSSERWLGLFLFTVASIMVLNAIAKRVPQVGAALESV